MSNFITAMFNTPTLEFCYRMGRDYAANGANEENCHFLLFSSPERTKEWERGRDDAKAGRREG